MTWKNLLILALEENEESFEDIIFINSENLDFSNYKPICFMAWTNNFIYFPTKKNIVKSVPRNPCNVGSLI
ncbi:MAG: hypothetical protein ACFFG0_08230 [Candidatus Thorarchaeota archaeon]